MKFNLRINGFNIDTDSVILTARYCLQKDIPSLSKLSRYLNKLLRIIMKLNVAIVWTAPSGLKITLSIRQFASKKTHTSLVDNSRPVTIKLPLNKLNTKKIMY